VAPEGIREIEEDWDLKVCVFARNVGKKFLMKEEFLVMKEHVLNVELK